MVIEVEDGRGRRRGPPHRQRAGAGGPGRRAAVRREPEAVPDEPVVVLDRGRASVRAGAGARETRAVIIPPWPADVAPAAEDRAQPEPEPSRTDPSPSTRRSTTWPTPRPTTGARLRAASAGAGAGSRRPRAADPGRARAARHRPRRHDPRRRARPGAVRAARSPASPGSRPAPSITRPVARLVFSSGQAVEVDRVILIGRAPEARRFPSDRAAAPGHGAQPPPRDLRHPPRGAARVPVPTTAPPSSPTSGRPTAACWCSPACRPRTSSPASPSS